MVYQDNQGILNMIFFLFSYLFITDTLFCLLATWKITRTERLLCKYVKILKIALHTTPGVVHENKVQNLCSSVWRTLDLWQGHTILLPSSVQSPAQREGLWPSAAQLSITFLQVWDKQCLLLPQPPLHTHLGPWSDQSIDIAWSPPIPLSFSFVEFFIPIDRSGNR